jgi:RHS repeat-associated protein
MTSHGNRTSWDDLTEGAYNAAETYTLDALNRLTSVTYPGPTTTTYTYDANGNRLTKTAGGVTTNYTYDNADRMTVAGGASYTYDANGNLTARGTDTFSWDYASRMTGATVSGTASTYVYDGADVRVSKTVGGVGTTYLWDREDGLASLADNGTSAYLHADGVLGEVTGATRQDLLLDSLGSVRGATNFAGTVTATADYDAFGAVRASTGSAAAFGFTGEQLDTETSFEYLRARYYDPTLGRFPSADTVQPNAPGTQGYNRYAYTANNPTTWVDPSGHSLATNVLVGAASLTLATGFLALVGGIVLTVATLECAMDLECRTLGGLISYHGPRPFGGGGSSGGSGGGSTNPPGGGGGGTVVNPGTLPWPPDRGWPPGTGPKVPDVPGSGVNILGANIALASQLQCQYYNVFPAFPMLLPLPGNATWGLIHIAQRHWYGTRVVGRSRFTQS